MPRPRGRGSQRSDLFVLIGLSDLVPFQLFGAIFRKSHGMLCWSYRIKMYRLIKLERH